jgi:hypothetical protein
MNNLLWVSYAIHAEITVFGTLREWIMLTSF